MRSAFFRQQSVRHSVCCVYVFVYDPNKSCVLFTCADAVQHEEAVFPVAS